MTGSSALFFYCVAIAAASLGGGIAARRLRVSHLGMQLAMSFVGGLILGVAALHMLPHAVAASPGSLNWVSMSVLLGIIGMLLLMRVFNVHQHQSDEVLLQSVEGGLIDPAGAAGQAEGASLHVHGPDCDHDHEPSPNLLSISPPVKPNSQATDPASRPSQVACNHDHSHHGHAHHAHGASDSSSATFHWLGLAIGMTFHSLLDGVALAAFVATDQHQHQNLWWHMPGFGIFLAVLFHKPLDASSIIWLMRSGGWTDREMIAINVLFAAMTPIGALLFHWGLLGSSLASDQLLAMALGFSAGVFLCISLSDILPEVQFHSHDRTQLTAALLLGVFMAWLVGLFEPSTAHIVQPAPVLPTLSP